MTGTRQMLQGLLWTIGIGQRYQLFDWIDARNHRIRYEVTEVNGVSPARRVDSRELFPATNRSALLQLYLHDLCWLALPPERADEIKRSIALRVARRYCRRHAPQGTIVVSSTVERITPGPIPHIEQRRNPLFSFAQQHGRVVLLPASGPRDRAATPPFTTQGRL